MKNKNLVKITLMCLSSLSTMCTGVVSPALPIIQKALEADGATDIGLVVKMMVVLPNVFIAIFAPIFGMLAPKIGKLRLLFGALVVYAIAGSSGAFLPTIYHILISRAILGITIAAVLTVVTTLIADYFDGPERSSLIGMQTMFMSVGSTVYGFLAGVLADIGWRNIFFLYAMALIYLPMAIKFLFNPEVVNYEGERIKTDRKIVQNNVAILSICCVNMFVMVMFYMIKIQLPYMLYGDSSINYVAVPHFHFSPDNAGKIASFVAITLFISLTIAYAFVKIFKKSRKYIVICCLLLVEIVAFFLLLCSHQYTSIKVNAKLVAICLSVEVIITTFVAFKYRRLKANRDFAVMCATGLAFMALSYLMLTHSLNYWMILVSMAVCGIGMGMLMPNSTLWVISITKPERRPLFIGIFNTSTYAGKFLSPFIAMPLLYFIPNNPRMLFQVCAFMMLFVAVSAMWMNDKFKRINKVIYRKERKKEILHDKIGGAVNTLANT